MLSITDIVYDVDSVIDLLADRPNRSVVEACVSRARLLGLREWLPIAVSSTLDVMLTAELRRSRGCSTTEAARTARILLRAFTASCQWLSSLAGDGLDWQGAEPKNVLIVNALKRLHAGARLLTSDPALLLSCSAAITPESFLIEVTTSPSIPFIDLAAQQDRMRGAIEEGIHRVLLHGHYIMGPEIAELELKLSTYVGVKHCITCASGTDSLEIAMRALGVGHGDEVITTPFTWISTAETICQIGAVPVFVDIEPVSFNINVELIEAAITPRTKAIMPVSLFGQMADFNGVNAIAARYGLPVIEDGAQSFGATQKGRRSCGVSTIGSTSFFPAKPLGCYGDGGALFTNDNDVAAKMRAIRTHGGEKRHHHPYIGMNGRMDTLQAAIVLAKLEQWDNEVVARGRIGARFTELLTNRNPRLIPPFIAHENTHVYAQYTIRVSDRDAVATRMQGQGIPTAVYYPKSLHEQPCFVGRSRHGSLLESERASREVLSLPMHPYLETLTQDTIISALLEAISS